MTELELRLERIDNRIMDGLKDFQRATVERIDHLYRNGHNRVLVSDEVGLGKTLVAKGVVSKMARLRVEEHDDLFKVVYICSNSAIADQNLQKLRISKKVRTESVGTSRLSMQHLNVFLQENDEELKKNFVQLIPLTPDTSFRMTSGEGMVGERALMYAILRHVRELKEWMPELETLMRYGAPVAWNSWAKDYYEERVQNCEKVSGGTYLRYMLDKLDDYLKESDGREPTLLEKILSVCRSIREKGEDSKSYHVIGELRVVFAKISLEKLEPDLVIMDEFQRFKYLLNSDPNSETGMLTEKFFHSKECRMLLLSATPFKMYSTLDEIDETHIDEHYIEFLTVMDFLNEGVQDKRDFLTVWKNYSVKLKELTVGDTALIVAKKQAETAMYQTVCRTERISAKENADIIDDHDVTIPLQVLEQDITSYVQAQELLGRIGANYNVPVDYVKSTPYLLSFMRDYQLKRHLTKYFKEHPDEIRKVKKSTFWLNERALDRYDEIPINNARLERVSKLVLPEKQGVEKLLWMPPSRPYYGLQGVFKGNELASKTLVFSSWEMVPRMLASMLSYEAEQRTAGKLARDYQERDVHYFASKEKRYPASRMNFSVGGGAYKGMALFCLVYPSMFLTKLYDPINCMNEGLSLKEIRRTVKVVLEDALHEYPSPDYGRPDNRWYYIAPMLLDEPQYVSLWLESKTELAKYEEGGQDRNKGFSQHLENLCNVYMKARETHCDNLGKRPDDLLDVLVDVTLASPAVCMNRTYMSYAGEESFPSYLPSQFARVFLNRMNTSESTAVVELACGRKSEDAHWKNLLTYSVQGNLQAVFDEYVHLLVNGVNHEDSIIAQVHNEMVESINIRTTIYNVDTYKTFKSRIEGEKEKKVSMRSHFAVAFTKGDGGSDNDDRKKVLRNAFNSPFRPFVLATTSIGQEGLDFHNYCRKIVHWNLPSNPIDLEQREGRINRFECLAIRQNVARRYGDIAFKQHVWEELFEEAARREKREGVSDLIPYWSLTDTGDTMVKIERIVPMYPFSRDVGAYERLIKILSLYRLTLGQARQEELLEYLLKTNEKPEQLSNLFINLSPYYRPYQPKMKVKAKAKDNKNQKQKRRHHFAEEYLALYSDPNTIERSVDIGFPEKCISLGFKMDLGKSFVEAYSQEAADDAEALKAIIHTVDDPRLLGTAIFSKWRFVTHWAESSLLEEKYRQWFITAFKRLVEITEDV